MMTILELTLEYTCSHDLRPASITAYNSATKAFVRHFGNCLTTEVDNRSVLAWRKKLLDEGLAKRSWNTYSSHLRTLYSFGIEHGLTTLLVNPFKKTGLIPPRRRKKTVVADAIDRARNWLKSLYHDENQSRKRSKITPAWFWLTVFETFYFTGLRLNALLCLTLADVDIHRRLIHVKGDTEKTHREFQIPIPDGLMTYLVHLVKAADSQGFQQSDQLFNVNRFSIHYRSKQMNVDQVEGMYKKLTKGIGVRMTPHRFRHTIASDLMKQPDRNIHVTKMLLNHSNIATTMEYIEPDYDFMREVLNDRGQQFEHQTYSSNIDRTPPSSARPAPIAAQASPPKLNPEALPVLNYLLESSQLGVGEPIFQLNPPVACILNKKKGKVGRPRKNKTKVVAKAPKSPVVPKKTSRRPDRLIRRPAAVVAVTPAEPTKSSPLPMSECPNDAELAAGLEQLANWLRASRESGHRDQSATQEQANPQPGLMDKLQSAQRSTFRPTSWLSRSG